MDRMLPQGLPAIALPAPSRGAEEACAVANGDYSPLNL
jgi:hypothetical protein